MVLFFSNGESSDQIDPVKLVAVVLIWREKRLVWTYVRREKEC